MSAKQENASAAVAPSCDREGSVLLTLAAKVERATGPDRELDGEIEAALERYPEGWSRDSFIENIKVEFHHVEKGRVGLKAGGGLDHVRWNAPAYTASLDAAMTLVPEGWSWAVDAVGRASCFMPNEPKPWPRTGGLAKSPALALCAAALRARASNA
jgi:hypothetical protein